MSACGVRSVENRMQKKVKKMKIVIKVGTSTLCYKNGNLNLRRFSCFVRVLSDLKNSGHELVVVTSGAVGLGVGRLGLGARPKETALKQACAAVGQSELMRFYADEFGKFNHTVAQVLLTRDVVENAVRHENAINTFRTLLAQKVVPVVNANDTVSVEQLDFDENDTLSAVVATLCEAEMLMILTDVDGLYDKNPSEKDAKFIAKVGRVDEKIFAFCGKKGSELSSGGMVTKLQAVALAQKNGIKSVIINGENPEILYEYFAGQAKCTEFDAL